MAITIQNAPSTYYSVHDDIIFTVCDIVKASDPVTYPDFQYVCDVYVASTLVARLKAYPNPTNKCGVFSIGDVLRNYITTSFNPTSAIRAQELGVNEFNIVATMKFGEEYDFTLYTNVTVDSARTYYNHYNSRLLGVASNLSNFVDKPMTNRIAYTSLSAGNIGFPVYTSNKNCYIPFLPSDTSSITLRIKSFLKDGTQITTQDQAYSPAAANTLQLYNLSPTVLNTAYPGLIPLTVASYYTVQFLSSNIVLDKILKFDLVCEPKFTVYTLHFLNQYGGFESRDFTKVSRKTLDIEKQEFGKLGYTMDSSGVVSYKNSNNVYNETRSVYSSSFKEKMVLNTDILSDSEYTWLADLILSPLVYIEMQNSSGVTYFVPCSITSNNYEFRKAINDKLTNLTLNIEFGERFTTQFR